jgi:hypothetical protein
VPRKRPVRFALGIAALLGVGIAVALVAGEITLRLLDQPRERRVGWDWRGNPAERNELGFRGHRAVGQADDVVLLVGDSQVETTHPFARMPEVFLSAALRELTHRETRVISVGATGWGQDQELLALRRAIPLIRPRMVVLWFTPRNDLWNNTFPTHIPRDGWPKPTFWLEGDTLRGPHAPWGAAYRPPGLRLRRVLRQVLRRPLYVTDAEWESKLPPPYRADAVGPGRARSFVEFEAAQYGLPEAEVARVLSLENFENEKTHASIALTPRSQRLEYSIRLTRSLLGEIARLCRQHDVIFRVFYVDLASDLGLPAEPTPFEVSGRIVTLSQAAERAVVRDVLADLPTIVLSGYRTDFRLSKIDSHLNAEGNRFFMTQLAGHLAGALGR